MNLRIMLTGATGFVGEGVLLACLNHPAIAEVLIINRKPTGRTHPKLRELLVPDFMALESVSEHLKGYDACFFCAGISSVGMNEAAYTHITYNLTLHVAQTLLAANPAIVFNFVSGSHTDSSEQGRIMWARVKGKTENALMKLPFQAEYNFRPGGMKPYPGQRNAKPGYTLLITLLGWLSPKRVVTLQEVAEAMIYVVRHGYPRQILEISDIKQVASKT